MQNPPEAGQKWHIPDFEQKGDLVFLPAGAKHSFEGDLEIVLLVFYAPNFTGLQG